jgi:hypothetical protein
MKVIVSGGDSTFDSMILRWRRLHGLEEQGQSWFGGL